MNEYILEKIKILVGILIIIISVVLLINGHKEIGPSGLIKQLISIGLLLTILFIYNKSYTK